MDYEVLDKKDDIIATAPTLAHAVLAAQNLEDAVRIWGSPESEYFTCDGESIE